MAWPLFLTSDHIAFTAEYNIVLRNKSYEPPKDVLSLIECKTKVFLPPNSLLNSYVWSSSLTTMREASIAHSNVRVLAGGKLEGYKGKMSGVLEEFLIALEQGKPIYLIGGLGGLCHKLCTTILNNELAEEFSEEWQNNHNPAYSELQDIARENSHYADYDGIRNTLTNLTVTELAQNSGLDETDYKRLMETPFVDEVVHLILKGFQQLP